MKTHSSRPNKQIRDLCDRILDHLPARYQDRVGRRGKDHDRTIRAAQRIFARLQALQRAIRAVERGEVKVTLIIGDAGSVSFFWRAKITGDACAGKEPPFDLSTCKRAYIDGREVISHEVWQGSNPPEHHFGLASRRRAR